MRIETITSAQNPKIRLLMELQDKSKTRRKEGLFVVEGQREIEHCIASGYKVHTVFICPEILGENRGMEIHKSLTASFRQTDSDPNGNCAGRDGHKDEFRIFEITKALYDKVAYRGGTEGIIAEMFCHEHSLSNLKLKKNPLIVVLEAVEKPGNLGAVLRSADASGADAVIICDPLTDLYNPNLIRSSIGGIFTVQTAAASSEDTIAWLKAKGIRIYTAQLQDSEWYYDTDMTGGTAIVMGTEATGLTQAWRQAADAHIKIPMLGRLDSLNVSVSAAILLFEAVRQRTTEK